MNHSIKRTVLDNGLTVISESIPSVRSLSIGVWLKTGSRSEDIANNGIAHFIEHMVFKGTKKRSALKIAQSLEDLGGSLNAYTSKEITCFFTHTLDTQLSISINVLSDMVCNSLFREKDIEKERMVVLEEISSVKDTPEEYIFDLFQEKLYPGQSIGYPILGTPETVSKFDRSAIEKFWSENYQPENIIISAAGNVNHDKLIKQVEQNFHFNENTGRTGFHQPEAVTGFNIDVPESFNQSHICIGLEGMSYHAKNRFELIALNTYLGGGMSSRLFQVVREKNALAYSVYSMLDFYSDTGVMSIYLGTDKRHQERAIDMLYKEIDRVNNKPLSGNMVHKLKEQLKGSYVLSLESISRRMSRLAKNEISYRRQIPLDEVLSSIDRINPESMIEVARKIFVTDNFNILKLSPSVN